MAEETSPTSGYTMGYSEDFQQLLNAAAWRPTPHICSRISSTASSIEESQIDLARSAAEAGGHGNVTFHVGSVTELPFEDNSFDVAHCHAVFMHVPDTTAALAEVKRVLKPGGIIASREMIVASSFMEPTSDSLRSGWSVFARLLAGNGGHPQMGKDLKNTFIEAGFTNVRATASFDVFSTPEDVAFLHAFVGDWFFSPRVIAAATAFGLVTQQQFDEWRLHLDQWKSHPGAVGGFAFGECIATKP